MKTKSIAICLPLIFNLLACSSGDSKPEDETPKGDVSEKTGSTEAGLTKFEILTAFHDERLVSYSYESNTLSTIVEDGLAPEYTIKPLILDTETGGLSNHHVISQDNNKLVVINRVDGSKQNLRGQESSRPCYYSKSFVSPTEGLNLTFAHLSGNDDLCDTGNDDFIARLHPSDEGNNDEVIKTDLNITPKYAFYDSSGAVIVLYGEKTKDSQSIGVTDQNLNEGAGFDGLGTADLIQTGPRSDSSSTNYALITKSNALYLGTAEELLHPNYQLPSTPIFSAENSLSLPKFNRYGTNISLFIADSSVYQLDRISLTTEKLFDLVTMTSVANIELHGDSLIIEIFDMNRTSISPYFKTHIYSYTLSTGDFSPMIKDKRWGSIQSHGDVLAMSYGGNNSNFNHEPTVTLYDSNLNTIHNLPSARVSPYSDLTSNSQSMLIQQDKSASGSLVADLRLYSVSKDNGSLEEILNLGDVPGASVSDAQDNKLLIFANKGTDSKLYLLTLAEPSFQSSSLPSYELSPIFGQLN